MFWSIISESDITFSDKSIHCDNSIRSSNPFDYLRKGYYIDNASLFGGENVVDFNSDFSSNRAGGNIHIPGV